MGKGQSLELPDGFLAGGGGRGLAGGRTRSYSRLVIRIGRAPTHRRSLRVGTVLGVVVSVLPASAGSAGAAVTRIKVEWSAQSPPGQPQSAWEFSPYVSVFVGGSGGGGYTGPCSQEGNCEASPGFHWEEANPNPGGYAQAISFVDEQPTRARQVCFEISHPYATDYPTDPQFSVVVTATDPDGQSRSRSFTLVKGQRTDVDCTPVFRPIPELPAKAKQPPAWWLEGRKLLKARGGSCKRSTDRLPASDPRTGRPEGTYMEVSVVCSHAIPKRLFVKFGGNPAAPNPAERCSSLVTEGRPEGDGYAYSCEIFSGGGRRAKLTTSSWSCARFKSFERYPGGRVLKEADRTWSARRSTRSRKYRVKTLAGCLARRPGP
jgi:hypothetical protein